MVSILVVLTTCNPTYMYLISTKTLSVTGFVCLFIILRPAYEYFTYMETSPLAKFRSMLGAQGF
jgi:hypothetical protein